MQLVARRDDFRAELAKHWQSHNIDVCLAPVGATPAPKLTTAKYWNVSGLVDTAATGAHSTVHLVLESGQLPRRCVPDRPVSRSEA